MNGNVISEITAIRPIRDIVYEYLRNAIMDGVIKPGERIVEREYAEKFGVSRTPIREVLRKLEMDGLIEYIPRQGVVAKSFNRAEIEEIYAIRVRLETLAIKIATEKITEQQLNKVKNMHLQAIQASDQGNFNKVADYMRSFDDLLFESIGMPKLRKMIAGLQESLSSYRKINLSSGERRDKAIKEHTQILQAVVDKDSELAEMLLRKHIERARDSLLEMKQV